MRFFARLFGTVFREALTGAWMGPGPEWSVEPINDASAFFRALPDLLPPGSILYLEDPLSDEGAALASRHRIEPQLQIALGSCGGHAKNFHLPLTRETADALADFAAHHATPEIGMHIHAYHGDQVLLEWHDAFGQPLRLSTKLPESRVRAFCESLHCNYTSEAA